MGVWALQQGIKLRDAVSMSPMSKAWFVTPNTASFDMVLANLSLEWVAGSMLHPCVQLHLLWRSTLLGGSASPQKATLVHVGYVG